MRNWTAYVRAHLKLPALTPEREAHIVRELAAQLEDFYREALARGASGAEADPSRARRSRLGPHGPRRRCADRRHARPRGEPIAESALHLPSRTRSLADAYPRLTVSATRSARWRRRRLHHRRRAHAGLRIGASSSVFTIVKPRCCSRALSRAGAARDGVRVVPRFGRFSVARRTSSTGGRRARRSRASPPPARDTRRWSAPTAPSASRAR